MTSFRIALKKLDGVTPEQMWTGQIKPRYNCFSTHIIFYIKMDGKFIRKDRFVADSYKTDVMSIVTYSSVVSRDSIRIAFIIAS